MLLHNNTFTRAINRHGGSQLSGKRALLPSALARLAQYRRHQQQQTKLCALPVDQLVHDLHTHAAAVYDLADAAAAAAAAADTGSSSSSGFLSPLTDTLETVLKTIQSQLNRYNVPYSYGYSIILLTVFVKMLTLPLTKIQIESSMAVQSLKPRIDMMKARYGDDKKKIQRETSILYEQAGVNPLAGCLPSIATIPIFIGLYRSLMAASNEGLFEEGFYWIPTLAGPVSLDNRGIEWLWPFVNGAPPIGWDDASHYLVLPVLLIICQYISSAIISPPIDPNAENANTQRALYTFLPLMVGWFALNVPSGLGLYYLSNTVITTSIQVWLRKLGGADVKVNELGPITKVGTGRRLGPVATDDDLWQPSAAYKAAVAADAAAAAAQAAAAAGGDPAAAAAAQLEQQQAAAAVGNDSSSSHIAAAAAASSSSKSSGSQLPSPGARWAKRKRITPAAAPSSA